MNNFLTKEAFQKMLLDQAEAHLNRDMAQNPRKWEEKVLGHLKAAQKENQFDFEFDTWQVGVNMTHSGTIEIAVCFFNKGVMCDKLMPIGELRPRQIDIVSYGEEPKKAEQ